MATLTFSPIQLTNWDRDNIQKLNTWLFQLMENLRYVLDNIGEENVSTELMKEIEIINTYKQELDKLEEKMEKVDLQYKEEIAQLNGEASTSKAGLMSASDKSKLEGIDEGANKYTHPTTSGNKHIPSGGSSGQILRWSSDGTAVWGSDKDTTYSDFIKSGSGAKSGLVPVPPTTAGTTKYLREDGTWTEPPNTNTTYGEASTSKAGLMSASDKSKLEGIDKTWKNIYSSTPKTAFSISSITSGDYTEIIVRVEYYDSSNLYREALIAIPIWEITRDGGNVYRYYYIGHQTATVSIGINKNKIFLAWLNAGGVTYTEASSTNMYVYYR